MSRRRFRQSVRLEYIDRLAARGGGDALAGAVARGILAAVDPEWAGRPATADGAPQPRPPGERVMVLMVGDERAQQRAMTELLLASGALNQGPPLERAWPYCGDPACPMVDCRGPRDCIPK